MRSGLPLLLSVLLGAGCSVEEPTISAPAAIEGGAIDESDTAVVALANTAINELCSGARIAPNLVLTAAHCVSTTATSGQTCAAFTFGGVVDTSKLLYTHATVAPQTTGDYAEVQEVLTPAVPGESLCDRDIALVLLKEPIADGLLLLPRLDAPMSVGEAFAAVGYGQSGDGAGIGTRRRLDGLTGFCVGDCGKSFTGALEWIGHPSVAHTGGRPGDSGSPALTSNGEVTGVFVRHLEYPGASTLPDELVYTSIDAHEGFLRDGAVHAAEIGGYDPPDWAAPQPVEPPPKESPPTIEEGCAAAPGPALHDVDPRALLPLTSLVAALAARSRSRSGAARRRVQPARGREPRRPVLLT
ncbi:MAG: trypsin-like serine protease [Polyangiaceae bacterium]